MYNFFTIGARKNKKVSTGNTAAVPIFAGYETDKTGTLPHHSPYRRDFLPAFVIHCDATQIHG
jgi:hypothetical protein